MPTNPQLRGRRAGATWVAAVGAFLLVVAAAVFVAVRWQRLSAPWKLAVVAGVTAACLGGGRWLRRSLPATGDVLFHLGAFLLPVDLAAAANQAGLGWRPLVLAEGLLGVVVLGGLGGLTGSVVLRWAGVAALPLVAAGVAAFAPVPAPLVLAGAAVAAEVALRRRPGTATSRWEPLGSAPVAWAALAGLGPLLGAACGLAAGVLAVGLGTGTLADLGLTAQAQVLSAAPAGALAATVLARRAHRHGDVRLAFLAMVSAAVGVATSVTGAHLPPVTDVLNVAAAFAVVELVALALRRDPFWSRPLAQVASGTEATVGTVSLLVAAGALLDPWSLEAAGRPDPVVGLALGAAALAWLAADLRRPRDTTPTDSCLDERRDPSSSGPSSVTGRLMRGGGWPPGTLAASACLVTGTALASRSGLAAAMAMVAVTTLALAGRRPGATVMAGVGAPWALAAASGHPVAASALGMLAATVAAYVAASGRSRGDGPLLLALSAVGTTVLAGGVVADLVAPDLAVIVTAVALWLLAWVLEGALSFPGDQRSSAVGSLHPAVASIGDRMRSSLGDCARAALVLPVLAALAFAPRQTLFGVCVVVGLYVVDAVRLDRPLVGCAAGLVVQALVIQAALVTGLTAASTGLALCVAAVGWSGLAAVVDARWRPPFVVAAAAGLGLGLTLSTADPRTLGSALLMAGALVAVAGTAVGRTRVAHGGGVLVCLGLAVHMQQLGVTAPEPYLVPFAAQSLVLGWQLRRSRQVVSSWVAYAPAVVVVGGVALAERLGGGGGGHALAAGAVGVAAVAVGGWRRLLGPLMVGTALLVIVTVNESLGALAGVPTWAWLGTAGLVLLAVGVSLERRDTSPTEAGLRLVDVLAERYD